AISDTMGQPGDTSDMVSPIIYAGNMTLDDDGTGDRHLDDDHRDLTLYKPNGFSLNADIDSYVAIRDSALSQCVRLGDQALVIGNGGVTSAVVGDAGSPVLGEVSLRTAWNLGVPTVDLPGQGRQIPEPFGPVCVT